MKIRNRIIALLLCCIMLISAVPASVFAAFDSVMSKTEQRDKTAAVTADTVIWDGKSKDTAWYSDDKGEFTITTAAQLAGLSVLVNEQGKTFEGKSIKLERNVDWGGNIWISVGTAANPFKGTFDGNHLTVSNVKLSVDQGKSVSTLYVGFFGYISGATIKQLGIGEIDIDVNYTANSVVGGLIAYAENSNVENSYVSGDINTTYNRLNPLDREDCKTVNISDISGNLSDYSNSLGQGVVINLGTSSEINKTITIAGDTSAVKLVGQAGTKYNGLNIVVGESNVFNAYIEFENVDFFGNDTKGAVYSTSNRSIYLVSSGSENAIHGCENGKAISAESSTIYIIGDAKMSVFGGNGSDGSENDKSGKSGGTGILCENLVSAAKEVYVNGGNGGNGFNGANGISATAAGQSGTNGIDGGNGGNGGEAIASKLFAVKGELQVIGGNGGNGADGGNGGNGAKGRNGVHESSEATNGGNGGNGGHGGNGGNGANSLAKNQILAYDGIVSLMFGVPGNGGHGGDGGHGGNGGDGDTFEVYKWVIHWANDKGYKGGNGGQAGSGGNGGQAGDYCKISEKLLSGVHCLSKARVSISNSTSDCIVNSSGGARGNVGSGGAGGKRRAMKFLGGWAGYYYFKAGTTPENKAVNGSNGNAGIADTIRTGISGDKLINTDVFFSGNNSSISTYRNATLDVVSASDDNPLGLEYELKIISNCKTDEWGFSGYYHGVQSAPNKVFYFAICAKLPEGSNIELKWNKLGNSNYLSKEYNWITDNSGTGKWQWYIAKVKCWEDGIADGNFQDLGYVALKGAEDNLEWRVAYTNVYDAGTSSQNITGIVPYKTTIITSETEYSLIDNKLQWATAADACSLYGGHLITVNSAEEQAIAEELINKAGTTDVWMGAKRVVNGQNIWSWVTNEDFTYTNWNTGEPNDSGAEEDYVHFTTGGKWNDVKGSRRYPYICEKDIGSNAAKYEVIDASLTWEEAKILCEAMGGHLATISSGEEQNEINNAVAKSGVKYPWIGAYREANDSNGWAWVTGEPFDWTNWNSGEPSNSGGSENYVHLYHTDALLGKWNDAGNTRVGFVFEKEGDGNSAAIACAGISKSSSHIGMLVGEAREVAISTSATVIGKISKDGEAGNADSRLGSIVGEIDNGSTISDTIATEKIDGEYRESSIQHSASKNRYNHNVGIISSNLIDSQDIVYTKDYIGYAEYYSASDYIGDESDIVIPDGVDIIIPDYVFVGKFVSAVTKIENQAFANASSIRDITIGKNVTSIGDEAFYGCSELNKFDIPNNVTQIGDRILAGCNNITSIFIGSGISSIPEMKSGNLFGIEKNRNARLCAYFVDDNSKYFTAKNGILYQQIEVLGANGQPSQFIPVAVIDAPVNSDLQELDDTIVKIYPSAFRYNKNIKNIDLKNVSIIGDYAFSESSMSEVLFGKSSADYEIKDVIKILDKEYEYEKPFVTQIIGKYAFWGCSLTNVSMDTPNIYAIGDYAFADCGGNVQSITLGKNVRIIGENAFSTVGAGDGTAFTCVKEYNVNSGNKYYKSLGDGVLYKIEDSGLILINYPCSNQREFFDIPDSVKFVEAFAFSRAQYLREVCVSDRVEKIADSAFSNSNIEKITIGSSVKAMTSANNIDYSSSIFDNCPRLREIIVSDENKKFSSSDGVLFNKDKSVLYKYPSGKLDAEYKIPSTVKKLNKACFESNSIIESVIYESENSLETIGEHAFYNCINLSTIFFKGMDAFKDNCLIGDDAGWFDTYPLIDKNNKFTNPRTVIYYSQGTNGWNEIARNEKCIGYSFSEYNNVIGSDIKESSYYTVAVVNKKGKPLNSVTVSLTDANGEKDIKSTSNGLAVLIDTNSETGVGFSLDFEKPYILKVVDPLGEYFPFENASFYLDEETRVTYITLSSVPTVSGVSVEYEVKSADKIKKLLTDDASSVVVGDGYKVLDMNSETAKINKWLTDKVIFTISCGIDKDYIIESVKLYQDSDVSFEFVRVVSEGEYETVSIQEAFELGKSSVGEKNFVTLKLLVSTESLANEKDLYVEVKTVEVGTKNSSTVKSKLNVQIFELDFYGIDTSMFNGGIHIDIPEWLKVILPDTFDWAAEKREDGSSYKFEMPKIIVDKDSFRVQFGYGNWKSWGYGEDQDSGYAYGEHSLRHVIERWNSYKNGIRSGEWLKNQVDKENAKKAPFEKTNKRKLSFDIAGYYEYKFKGIDAQGNCDIQREGHITGTIKIKQIWGKTFIFWVIPVRGELELSASGKLDFSLVFDKEAAQFCTPNLEFELEAGVTAYAGVGFAMASGGLYGELKTIFVLGIVPKLEVRKWTVKADLGLYAKYDGLIVHWKGKKSLLKWEGVIFDNTTKSQDLLPMAESGGGSSLSATALSKELYDESNYAIATSSAGSVRVLSISPTGEGELADYEAYSGMMPRTIQIGDKIYIVYQDDLARFDEEYEVYRYTSYKDLYDYRQYDKYNYQKIVYQIYDINTGMISDTYVLDDNGFSDGTFDVYYDGENAVIVYTQMNGRLNSDNLDDIKGYVSSMEVKTAVLDETQERFIASDEALTNDAFYDYNIKIGVLNDKLTAVWISNQENSMFGCASSEKPSSILYSVYENGQWSSPVEICKVNTLITDLELGNTGIAYITDSNNDLTTAIVNGETVEDNFEDRLIHIVDFADETKSIVSEKEAAFFDVSFVDGHYVYTLNNNLYIISNEGDYVISTENNAVLLNETIEALSSGYQILEDANGAIKAILYVASEDNCSNVYAIFCNEHNFGSPVKLTNYADNLYVQSFDAIDDGSGMWLSVLISESVSDHSDSETAYSETYQFETKYVDYPTGYSVGEITFDYDTVKPNEDVLLTIPIVNNSYLPLDLESIEASVNSGALILKQGFFDAEDKKVESNALLPGQSAYLKVSFNPGNATNDDYIISVGESSQNIKLWYSDFVVTGKQVQIGGQYCIVANVTNNGYLPGKYKLVAKYNDVIIQECETDELLKGMSQYFVIPLDESIIHEDTCIITVGVDADSEYYTANNTVSINVSITPELGSNEVSISPRHVKIDRSLPADLLIKIEEKSTLEKIVIDEKEFDISDNELFTLESTQDGKKIIFSSEYLLKNYTNGKYNATLQFSNGGKATATIYICQTFEIRWNIDGKIEIGRCDAGVIPVPPTPHKDGDDMYESYTFVGWDKEIVPASGDTTYTAVFGPSEKRDYSITWIVDGKRTQENYKYGDIPSDANIEKTKPADSQYTYEFVGWKLNGEISELSPVLRNTTYVAEFKAVLRQYKVVWTVDGIEYFGIYDYGSIPSPAREGVVIAKESDSQYSYVFVGWDKEIVAVTGEAAYTARFSKQVNSYTVSWIIDGEVSAQSRAYEYGSIPAYEGVPTKADDAAYSYKFVRWDRDIVPVSENVVYVAVFDAVLKTYDITWIVDGKKIVSKWSYGSMPTYSGTVEKSADEDYKYIFSRWEDAQGNPVTSVTEDATYIAIFDKIKIIRNMVEFEMTGPSEASVGSNVTYYLTVSKINDENGIEGIGIDKLLYSNAALDFVSADFTKKPSDGWKLSINDNGGYLTMLIADDNADSIVYNPGEIVAAITFRVKSSAIVGGNAEISIDSGEAVNGKLDSITIGTAKFSSEICQSKTLNLAETSSYSLDRASNYVLSVSAMTAVLKFKMNFSNDQSCIKVINSNGVLLADSNYVGTGCRVQLVSDDVVVDEMIIVVLGDVNGDGKINGTDYLRIRGAFLKTYSMSGEFLKAADVNGDGKINGTDYLRVRGHYLGTYNLYK